MANDCLNNDGDILHFPRSGSWHDQNRLEISLMKTAHYVRKAWALSTNKDPNPNSSDAKRKAGAIALANMHGILNKSATYDPSYLLHYGS